MLYLIEQRLPESVIEVDNYVAQEIEDALQNGSICSLLTQATAEEYGELLIDEELPVFNLKSFLELHNLPVRKNKSLTANDIVEGRIITNNKDADGNNLIVGLSDLLDVDDTVFAFTGFRATYRYTKEKE